MSTLHADQHTLTQVFRHDPLQHSVLPGRPAAPAQHARLLAVALLRSGTSPATLRLPDCDCVGVECEVEQGWGCELVVVAARAQALEQQ
jgi:hypothetical protein